MAVIHDDIQRIEQKTGLLPKEFCQLEDDGIRRLRNKSTTNGEKVCYFLNNEGQCSIYEIRPQGCRYYPLIWDLQEHKVICDDLCPHFSEFLPFISKKFEKEIENFIFTIYGFV